MPSKKSSYASESKVKGDSNSQKRCVLSVPVEKRVSTHISHRHSAQDDSVMLTFVYDTSSWQDRLVQLQMQHDASVDRQARASNKHSTSTTG
jgi:hypothetical protein